MWNPEQYNKYFKERHCPALELINRIPDNKFDSIIDLGCGDGVITQILRDKYQPSHILGLDSSESMLDKARHNDQSIDWQIGNISEFTGQYDLIFSNAALQWVDNHQQLFNKLVLQARNMLAIQVPNNFDYPSHVLLRETICENAKFKDKLFATIRKAPVLTPDTYFKLLYKQVSGIDIWQTEYLQQLTGDNAVLEWTRGTALVPIIQRLSQDEYIEFEYSYGEKLAKVYKPLENGVTLFPFKRIFIVATK